jgi:hypothetical protein
MGDERGEGRGEGNGMPVRLSCEGRVYMLKLEAALHT